MNSKTSCVIIDFYLKPNLKLLNLNLIEITTKQIFHEIIIISKISSQNFTHKNVKFITTNSTTIGDCLREIDAKQIIVSDFILLVGFPIFNINLTEYLNQFLLLKQKDSNLIMSCLLTKSSYNHPSRSKVDETCFVLSKDYVIHYEPFHR
jgi:translation initiation factor eIF-2B subunit epsilon